MPNPVITSNSNSNRQDKRLNFSEDLSQKVSKMEAVRCKRVKRKSLLKSRERRISRERTINRLVENMPLLEILRGGRKPILCMSYMLVLVLAALSNSEASSSSSASSKSNSIAIGQLVSGGQAQQQQQQISNFDATQYKNIQEAIRNHPDLREVSLPVLLASIGNSLKSYTDLYECARKR